MSLLSVAKKSLDITGPSGRMIGSYTSDNYRGDDNGTGFWYFGKDGIDYYFSYKSHKNAKDAYKKCPPVSAIINRKAQAFVNGKTWILDKDGKEVENKITSKIKDLLRKPNPLQTWKHYEAQLHSYLLLFGFSVVLPIKPEGFRDNIDASSIWNVPPSMVDIDETKKLFYQNETSEIFKQIVINYKGEKTILNVDEIMIMRDMIISVDSLTLPGSRIEGLCDPIANIIGAYESRRELINYAGSQGIISPESPGQMGGGIIKPDDKDALQEDFKRQYGIKKGQFRYVISNAAMKWQPMGMKTKDLMLFEEVKDDTKAICDGLGFPYRLLSSDESNSLGGSDYDSNDRVLYQNHIIPEAENIYEQWNAFFGLERFGLHIEKDYSHVQVLQADKGKEATARKTLNEALKIEFESGLITIDQWLEKLGEDPLEGGLGNVRAADMKNSGVPLAVLIGVGGVQSLIAIITAAGLSDEAKKSTLEILFGIKPEDAGRMVISTPTQDSALPDPNNENNNNNDQQTNQNN